MRASIIVISIFMLMFSILSFQNFQLAHGQTAVPLEDKALAYVKNVLPFDMSHYNITVDNSYSLPSAPNDATITQAVEIDLESSVSTIHVVCVYINGTLHQCVATPTGSPPVSDKFYANMKDVAACILQAHQEQTGLDSTSLIETLNLVNNTETANVTLGSVSLSVSHFPDIIGCQTINGMPVPIASNSSFSTTLNWRLIMNGLICGQFFLTFDKGIFCKLQDERATQPIAGTDSSGKELTTSSTPQPIPADQKEDSTLPSNNPQSTNVTSPQTNRLLSNSSQKSPDSQNVLVIPLLIAALAAYVTVIIVLLTYKGQNKANKNGSQKETNLFFVD